MRFGTHRTATAWFSLFYHIMSLVNPNFGLVTPPHLARFAASALGIDPTITNAAAAAMPEAVRTIQRIARGWSARRSYKRKRQSPGSFGVRQSGSHLSAISLAEDALNWIDVSEEIPQTFTPNGRALNRIGVRGLRTCFKVYNPNDNVQCVFHIAYVTPKYGDYSTNALIATSLNEQFFTNPDASLGYDGVDFNTATVSNQMKNCLQIFGAKFIVHMHKKYTIQANNNTTGYPNSMQIGSTVYCEDYRRLNRLLTYDSAATHAHVPLFVVYWVEPLNNGDTITTDLSIERSIRIYFTDNHNVKGMHNRSYIK